MLKIILYIALSFSLLYANKNIINSYGTSFGYPILNKISLLDKKVIDNKDVEAKSTLITERDELVESFLDSMKNSEIKLSNSTDKKNIELLKKSIQNKIDSKGDKNYLIEKMQINSILLDIYFDKLIVNIQQYQKEFHTQKEYRKVFTTYRDSVNFNNEEFDTYYEYSINIQDKSEIEKEFIKIYEHYIAKQHLYNKILFKQIKEDIYNIVSSNEILSFFKIERAINYFDNLDILKNITPLFEEIVGVTIGQLILSVLIFFSIVIFKFLFVPFLLNRVENFFIKNSSNKKDNSRVILKKYLEDSLKEPISILISIAALDISLRVLFMRYDKVIIVSYIELTYILLLIWTLFRLINNFVVTYSTFVLNRYPNVRAEMVNFLVYSMKITLFVIGLLITLNHLNYDITAILASLGIGGVAVAFASKDAIANVFGSISIILDNMFTQGDWIATSNAEGTVVDIGMRTTKIRTFDNAMIFVPNSYLANTDIKNWNKRRIGRRIKTYIGVEYPSSQDNVTEYMDRVLKAVEDIKTMLLGHEKIANASTKSEYKDLKHSRIIKEEDEYGIKKTLLVYLDSFEESSINIMIYCFSKTVQWDEWLDVKQDVLVKIINILANNSLTIAYPSQTNYVEIQTNETDSSSSFSD